jgi:hypothetical protein
MLRFASRTLRPQVVVEEVKDGLSRGKFVTLKGGISGDASKDAWEKHQRKRGSDDRAARLAKLLQRRAEGMWALQGMPLAATAAQSVPTSLTRAQGSPKKKAAVAPRAPRP